MPPEDPELEDCRNLIKGQFNKLFRENCTVRNFQYSEQFKDDMVISQQKSLRVPIHIQSGVEKKIQKFINEVGQDSFVSPVVITHKNDGTVKLALGSVEPNQQIVKKTMQLPLLAELLDPVSRKISKTRTDQLHVSTIDSADAFGQIELPKEMTKHYVAAIVGG